MIIDKKESGKWFIAKQKEQLRCPACMKRLKKFNKTTYGCTNVNCVYGESTFTWKPEEGGYLYSEFYKEDDNK